jgi:hypothetical protein
MRAAACLVTLGLVVGCGSSTPGGTAGSGGSAGGGGSSGGGASLFDELFGPQDPSLPGKACRYERDDCRGSSRLFVCIDDAGQPVATDTTCRKCTSDDQCRAEYYYYNSSQGMDVVCQSDGLCHPYSIVAGSDGTPRDGNFCEAPATGWCLTARLGWFVCGAQNRCARCASSPDCVAAFGCSWICPPNPAGPVAGACMEVQPPPPGCM